MTKKTKDVVDNETPDVVKSKVRNTIEDIDAVISKQFADMIDFSKPDEEIKAWVDSGVLALNYIGSKNLFNGYPCGRVCDIFGESGTGKSMLASYAAKDPTVEYVLYFETEGSPTKGLLTFLGVDLRKIRGLKCNTFESYSIDKKTGEVKEISDEKFPKKGNEDEKYVYRSGAIRMMRQFINQIEFNGLSNRKIVVILDSLGNMQTTREMNGISDVGYKNKKIGEFFRCFDLAFERTNILFLYTNKVYLDFMTYGSPTKQTGGVNVEFNPSLTFELKTVQDTDDISDSDKNAEKERRNSALGSSMKIIRTKVVKSRFGTELRRISFIIDFSRGPVKYSGLFELCRDFGVIEKAGSMWNCPGLFEKSFYKKDFANRIMENEKHNLDLLQKKLEEAEERIKNKRDSIQVNDLDDIKEIEEEENGESGWESESSSADVGKQLDRIIEK